MNVKIPNRPYAWVCRTCGKIDFADVDEPMAVPEHRPYRGIDLGTCDGEMIPLYTKGQIDKANVPHELRKNGE